MEQLCDGDQEQESFDEMADAGKEIAGATVFDSSLDCDGVDDSADIEPFVVPPQHRSALECPIMQAKELKKAGKFAFKFPEGWETATFRGSYRGKNSEFVGGFDFYLQGCKRKISMKLEQTEYGLSKSWVVFKKI